MNNYSNSEKLIFGECKRNFFPVAAVLYMQRYPDRNPSEINF